jgi:eukaryotic-like serine/threonine-protein kinase
MAGTVREGWKDDSWRLSPGDEVVPGCVMQSLLGGGVRHEVYAAFDQRLLAPVVIKIVRPGLVRDSATLRATRREIDVLTKVSHPVVVRLLDSMGSGPRPHLTMERVSGRTLSKVIHKDGPISVHRATEVGVALTSALHFAHLRGIVHLDIKPENVILGRPPRLIDFSLARPVDKAAALTSQVGTPSYAAPEQCNPPADGVPGTASDVWGVGMTLYEAVTRRRPFPKATTDSESGKPAPAPQLTMEPRPFDDAVPAAFAEVVMACLARDPGDRPTAEQAFYALAAQLGPGSEAGDPA